MLEIDNRYPEYARPYEPIKGRKRHGRLTGNESAFMVQRRLRRLDMTRRGFLTGVGVLIVLTVLMPEAKEELILPKVEPVIIELEKPKPEPEVIPVIEEPEEPPVVIPDPKPTPPKPKPKPDDKKTAPVIDLDKKVVQPDNEIYMYPTLLFTMKLNDLKGGKATGRVYVDTGSGFYEPDSSVKVVYDPSSTSGNEWSGEISCLLFAPEGGGIAGKAKIVFDIVYPDGEKAKIETETRPVHMGSYVRINTAYEGKGYKIIEDLDPETEDHRYVLKVDVLIDKTLVDPQNVGPDPEGWERLWFNENPWTSYGNYNVDKSTDPSGNYHLIYNFYSESPFPNGPYTFIGFPLYPENTYNNWVPDDFYYDFNVNE